MEGGHSPRRIEGLGVHKHLEGVEGHTPHCLGLEEGWVELSLEGLDDGQPTHCQELEHEGGQSGLEVAGLEVEERAGLEVEERAGLDGIEVGLDENEQVGLVESYNEVRGVRKARSLETPMVVY